LPKKEYIRRVSTLLFTGKASDFGAFSRVLLAHRNLVNHQITISSSGVLAAGVYALRIVPEEDDTLESSVDTGEILDIAGNDSAIAIFSGVLRGIHLEVLTPLSGGETISVVLSSYTKVAPQPTDLDSRTYLSTQILDSVPSDHGSFSALPLQHRDMFYHQLSLACSGVLAAGIYNVRIIPDVEEVLESSVAIGKELDIAGVNSALVQFTGVLKGIHLEATTPLSAGQAISVVLSSSTERYDGVIADAIAASPSGHVHVEADITDLDKFTQAQVNALIDAHAADPNTHTNLIVNAGFF